MATSQPRRVYLHIGSPKTGTTFLQHTLHTYREQLEPMGVFYPPSRLAAHHDEARDLRDIRIRGGAYHHRDVPGSWDRLVGRVQEWTGEGVVVISSEILAFADLDDARRAVRSLEPAEVHVVVTMRDLARQIPAAWQEMVKNRSTIRYQEFLRRLQDPADPHGPRNVWDAQDPQSMLARWAADLPADRVHLVTVPPRGQDPSVLWDRFGSVLGVGELALPPLPRPVNVSLGLAEAEVVRRLNDVTAEQPWPFYNKHVKHGIAQGAFAGTPKDDRLAVPESMLEWVRARTAEVGAFVRAGGYHVAGDLADLDIPEHAAGDARSAVPDADRLVRAWQGAAEYLTRELAGPATARNRPAAGTAGRAAGRAAGGTAEAAGGAQRRDGRLVSGARLVERAGRRARRAWRNRR